MIPPSEWKFFEGTEQRIKHLARHQAENRLALAAGSAPPWPREELAQRVALVLQEMDYPARVEAALEMDPTPEQTRHLELHRIWVIRALFETHPDLAPLLHGIEEAILTHTPEVKGRSLTPADRRRILVHEGDRALREAAYNAFVPLGERLAEDMKELVRRREMLARSVAETGFPDLAFHFHEGDRTVAVSLLDELERTTRTAFQEARNEVGHVLGLHEIHPWDLEFGLHRLSPVGSETFPVEQALKAARAQVQRWGLDAGEPTITPADSLLGTQVLSLETPGDVHVLLAPVGGQEGLRDAFRSMGKWAHLSQIRTRRHLLEQESPALLEATGRLFQTVLRDEGWLGKHLQVPADVVEKHLRAGRYLRIAELRFHAATTMFENLVYAQSDIDPNRLYLDVVEHVLQETRRPEAVWTTQFSLAVAPLGHYWGIAGEMVAAQLWERLKQEFSDPWQDGEVGAWLCEHFFRSGSQLPDTEKVLRATGKEPGLESLFSSLEVSFDGPALEDAESASTEMDDVFNDTRGDESA